MKATDIREFDRNERGVDIGNMNAIVRGVQELLGTSFNPEYFDVQSGSGGKIVSGKTSVYMKDAFHLTILTSKSVRVGLGMVWFPMQKKDETISAVDYVYPKFADDGAAAVDLTFGTKKYVAVWTSADLSIDANNRITITPTWNVSFSGDNTNYIVPADLYASASPPVVTMTIYRPLYLFEAQTGSGSVWDDYRLVYDARFGVMPNGAGVGGGGGADPDEQSTGLDAGGEIEIYQWKTQANTGTAPVDADGIVTRTGGTAQILHYVPFSLAKTYFGGLPTPTTPYKVCAVSTGTIWIEDWTRAHA